MTPNSGSFVPPSTASRLKSGFAVIIIASSLALTGFAQTDQISESAQRDIASIVDVKRSFSAGERKLSSNLVFSSRLAEGKPVGAAAGLIDPDIAVPGKVLKVVIKGSASAELLAGIAAHGGTVDAVSPGNDRIEASVPLTELEGLASLSDVKSIRQAPLKWTNVGALNTQGYIGHRANSTAAMGKIGTGVKVGVLSDSALPARVAALVASGDLGPGTTVLPGQAGPANGSDEGAAMMEIVQDLAPGCQLYFATAFTSETSFAQNILDLGAAGCKVIVDDVSYSDEFPFQDSVIAQAVNTFVASGGIYFSSAGNSYSKTSGAAGTWEGDFKDGGAVTGPIAAAGETGRLHDFGSGQTFNRLLQASSGVVLFWSDPIGGSGNDYDLFVLNSTGTTLKAFSAASQSGTDDPIEDIAATGVGGTYSAAANDRVVVVLFSGNPRALHLESLFGSASLSISTTGQTHGHNAGASTQCVAATYWNSAHTGTKPFNGTNNPTEVFSSDGPRKIFFNPNGSEITPGNVLFGTSGGLTLQKPDFTAADGVSTKTPGFNPFYGTSAAAPHAAAIAALVWGAKPSLTNTQVVSILRNTSLDNMAPGTDRDGGYGVLNALTAVQAALATP